MDGNNGSDEDEGDFDKKPAVISTPRRSARIQDYTTATKSSR